jgi:hypothetical protein
MLSTGGQNWVFDQKKRKQIINHASNKANSSKRFVLLLPTTISSWMIGLKEKSCRRFALVFPKHGYECTRTGIARFEGDLTYRRPIRQPGPFAGIRH